MNRIGLAICYFLLFPGLTTAQVRQNMIGENACGPCALINSLRAADKTELLNQLGEESDEEKARQFIEQYGNLVSETYGNRRTAYTVENGATDSDMQLMLNTFLKDQGLGPMNGQYVERVEDETNVAYVARIHELISQSLERGFHPLLSVRALAAEFGEDNGRFLWNSKGGHWIAVHEVGSISKDGLGFTIDFSDSLSGKNLTGYFYHEPYRKSTVPMTFTVDEEGNEIWNWKSSDQCMMLNSPGMPLGTARAKWYERTNIAIRYLIFKNASDE